MTLCTLRLLLPVLAQALARGDIPRRDRAGLGLGWLERGIEIAARSVWRGGSGGGKDAGEPSMFGDAAESAILVVLCAALWLVLWRRRQLRAAAVAPVPVVGGGAGRWRGLQQVSLLCMHDCCFPMQKRLYFQCLKL